MTRNAVLTVLLPGARIAPASSTWTWGHTRRENSGTNGFSRCSILVGRVRIITSLWWTGDDRTLPLLSHQMDKVERRETVWKLLGTGQAPHHQTRHRRIDKGLSCGAQPLVVLGHPPVVRDPGERSLYDPSTRQDPEASRRHQLLPIHLSALLSPLLSPRLGHLLRHWLRRFAHDLHAQTQYLLSPLSASPLVASVYPQVRKAQELGLRRLQQ